MEARIDKWLWAARIFKTRSIAADACKNGRVTINNVNVKPSRPVKVGEVVAVRKPPVYHVFPIVMVDTGLGGDTVDGVFQSSFYCTHFFGLEILVCHVSSHRVVKFCD